MAEIPVEHKEKSGFPTWFIPLLLLALLLLLFLLYRACNNGAATVDNTNTNRSVVTTNANNTAIVVNNNTANGLMGSNSNTAGAGSSGTITDVEYYGAGDQTTLAGRSVDFASARVNRVVSDRVFTVKSGKGEFYVMLDDALNAGDKEKQIQIKPGQNLKLGGEFRNVPSGEVKDEAQNRDLNAKNYAQMKNQKVYLHATSVSDVK